MKHLSVQLHKKATWPLHSLQVNVSYSSITAIIRTIVSSLLILTNLRRKSTFFYVSLIRF